MINVKTHADNIRKFISDSFDAGPYEYIILLPGILTGLYFTMLSLSKKKISITDKEYYGKEHFSCFNISVFDSNMTNESFFLENRPDAILSSLVSWKGDKIDVNNVFNKARNVLDDKSIYVCDYSHAGAIGFPGINSINADYVFGDICKWITPYSKYNNLAFMCVKEKSNFELVKNIFKPFFMALHINSDEKEIVSSRWINPKDIEEISKFIVNNKINKEKLKSIHDENMRIARRVSKKINTNEPETAIIWINENELKLKLKNTIIWHPPGGGTRIVCRKQSK